MIMKYSTKVGNAGEYKTGCLVLTPARARSIFRTTKHRDYVERLTADNAHGKTVVLALPDKIENVLVVGADEKRQSESDFRKNVDAASKALAQISVTDAVWHLNDIDVTNRDVYWKTRNALSKAHRPKPEHEDDPWQDRRHAQRLYRLRHRLLRHHDLVAQDAPSV